MKDGKGKLTTTWQKDKDYGEQYPYYHEDDLSCPQDQPLSGLAYSG